MSVTQLYRLFVLLIDQESLLLLTTQVESFIYMVTDMRKDELVAKQWKSLVMKCSTAVQLHSLQSQWADSPAFR